MSTTSGPNVPLRIGKSYLVPPIKTAASAVHFSSSPFLRRFSATIGSFVLSAGGQGGGLDHEQETPFGLQCR